MIPEIEVTIPKSSSRNLPRALRLARKFQDLTEPEMPGDSYQLRVKPDELPARHRDLEQLYLLIRNWKGAELRVGDYVGDVQDLRSAIEIFQCAERRSSAVRPDEYCNDLANRGWGCRFLRAVGAGTPSDRYGLARGGHYWPEAYWFNFGRFDDNRSKWLIDKDHLLASLTRQAASTSATSCPYFNMDTVRDRIAELPNEIDLANNSEWEIEYQEEYEAGAIQKLPVGIAPKVVTPSGPGLSIRIGLPDDEDAEISRRNRNIPEVSFTDIGGVDSIIDTVREVVELPLKQPTLFKRLGIVPHKGILLHGPPGCGKTLIAKAIANDIDAHFRSIGGPELFSKWFGESEENLRNVFNEARELAPSIIYFDEFDSIAQMRSGAETARHESVFVNQLLTLLDGMEGYEGVCVVASTNRLELLDRAVRRPGRFDYTIEIREPTNDGVRQILRIHSRNMPLAETVNLDAMAASMHGLSGAEIAFVAREAAYSCLRRSADPIALLGKAEDEVALESFVVTQSDFETALDTIVGSRSRPGDSDPPD